MPYNRYSKIKNLAKEKSTFPPVDIRTRTSDLFITLTRGNRFDLISQDVYEHPDYWWVILLANSQYANEFEIPLGEVIRVPYPLNDVLDEIDSQLGEANA